MNFLFMTFRLFLQKNFQPSSENFWLVCQKCKLGVQANKLSENCFWKSTKLFNIFLFWAKTFRTLARKFRQICQKCSPGEQFEEKNFFWKNYMFLLTIFGLRAKLFENFDGNFSIGFSNLLFTCPGEEFEKKTWKRIFLFNSLTPVKDLRLPAKTFQ